MIVRHATPHDFNGLINMLKHYRDVSPIPELRYADNETYIIRILSHILAGSGVIFVVEDNTNLIGMLIANRTGSPWEPDFVSMNELCWWVEPEFRHTSAAYKLINKYIKHCQALIYEGKLDAYTMSLMANSPEINYERFGLEKIETTYATSAMLQQMKENK